MEVIQEEKEVNTIFHRRKDINWWYFIGTLSLIVFGILLPFILPNNKYKSHVIINYFIFVFIQLTGWFSGQFKKDIANGFFKSIKAFDIYAHIYGGFTLYLFFLTIFNEIVNFQIIIFEITAENLIIFTFFFIPFFGIIYELVELFLELLFSYFENKKQIPGTYFKFISEPLGNVFQDVISDAIGSLIGLLYVLLLF